MSSAANSVAVRNANGSEASSARRGDLVGRDEQAVQEPGDGGLAIAEHLTCEHGDVGVTRPDGDDLIRCVPGLFSTLIRHTDVRAMARCRHVVITLVFQPLAAVERFGVAPGEA